MAGSDAYGVSGAILALAAAFGLAAGSVIVQRMQIGRELVAITGWQLLIAGVPLLRGSALVERGEAIA